MSFSKKKKEITSKNDAGDKVNFSQDHKQILEERLEEYKKNPSSHISLQQFIDELKAEGKL